MSKAIAQPHKPFEPKPSRTETKADLTNQAARAIIGAEAERREAKTARLRQARLEQEARLAREGKLAASVPTALRTRAKSVKTATKRQTGS